MAFVEMVGMVDILKRADYDGKYGPYPNPNVRKAKIVTKVVKSLHRNFGVRRSKDQLRKRWSDLELREHDQYRRIRRVLQKVNSSPVFLFLIFITFMLLHVFFFILLYSLKWQLSCSWTHYSFVGNIVRSAMFCPDAVLYIFSGLLL
ncbi:hypothetical protein AB205_0046200 [Aquarana catesbeiana]|uniref:Uncharacterized protein n=1 Tax=Aquarana catesbeiana TaxID=8400 RepID=A0A2G9P128_AQUCT|nr:hypothetical protein AB205_0046200 [Aquarana catesbeiana]